MKRRLFQLAILGVVFSALLHGAGTVTQTRKNPGNDTNLLVLEVDWTADSGDGSVPFTYLDRNVFKDGYSIVTVQTKPGSTAPTADYDVMLYDELGADLMSAACLNRSASAVEFCTTDPHPVNGAVQLRVTNNSVNSATGKIVITLTRTTVAKRGGTAGGGGAGVANDTYACAGSGNNTVSHNKNTLNVLVAAYDGSNQQTDWNTLTITDANTVTVNFTTAVASRRCVVNSSGGGSGGGGGGDEFQANKNQNNGYMGLDGSARAAKVNQHAQTVYADQTITWANRTGHLNMALGALRLPSGTARPANCFVGEIFLDTDATSGQRIYGCETTDTWVLQGDGGGGGGDTTTVANSGASGASVLKTSTNVTARKLVAGTNVTITENTDDITIAASGGGGSAPVWLTATVADIDIASLATACEAERTTTVSGATVGWPVSIVSPAGTPQGLIFSAHVSAPNTVKWAACTIGTVNPPIGTYIIYVIPPTV